jgi:hypothetical protein
MAYEPRTVNTMSFIKHGYTMHHIAPPFPVQSKR